MPTKTQEVATKDDKPLTLSQVIQSKQIQFKTLLPAHISPERFMRIIFTQMQKNPKLLQCTQNSILSSILVAAEMGLVPDGRKGALVPFKNKGVLEAQFIPMYKGLIELARNSGEIVDIFPATVYEFDDYSYELGLSRDLQHRVNLDGDRGKPIAYYAVVELKNGAKTFGAGPMTVKEMEAVKARSRASSGPWYTDFEPMAWKTVIKRVLNFCPQSAELAHAIEIDNNTDFGDDAIDMGAIEAQSSSRDELNKTMAKMIDKGKQKAAPKTPTDIDMGTGEIIEEENVAPAGRQQKPIPKKEDKPPTGKKPKYNFNQILSMIDNAETEFDVDDAESAKDFIEDLDATFHKEIHDYALQRKQAIAKGDK